jgi:hypothetical protein
VSCNFAPPALPGFVATMAPLTPARRAGARLVRAGLSASCAGPSNHSASNHPLGPPIALTRYPSAWEATGASRFGLRLWLAGSPRETAESSSLALRTGGSPRVASHPASRRRGLRRLQAGERLPEEDFHLSDHKRFQAHNAGLKACSSTVLDTATSELPYIMSIKYTFGHPH